MKNIIVMLSFAVLLYLLLIIMSQLAFNSIAFQPPRPPDYNDNEITHLLKLTTRDGKKISAIYLPNPTAKYTILYSNGNAMDLGSTIPLLNAFHDHGFAVFAYDYPGYGTSEGSASEKNVYHAIDAAYNYLTQQLSIPPQHIIAYGISIGTAAATDLASRKPIAGLILENSFTSAFRVITYWPFLPFDRFNNLEKINKVSCPILFIHGEKDKTIYPWHTRELIKQAKTPTYILFVKGAGHNNVLSVAGDDYWLIINKFVKALP